MFHVVLLEPEIPQNTGNIIRLCANTGANLHLVRPLGFKLDDRRLKRAGLDYHEWAQMQIHDTLKDFKTSVGPRHIYAFSTHGQRQFHSVSFLPGDAFVFGPETRGLGRVRLGEFNEEDILQIPMRHPSRSLNLANSVAIAVYEAWRQHDFADSP